MKDKRVPILINDGIRNGAKASTVFFCGSPPWAKKSTFFFSWSKGTSPTFHVSTSWGVRWPWRPARPPPSPHRFRSRAQQASSSRQQLGQEPAERKSHYTVQVNVAEASSMEKLNEKTYRWFLLPSEENFEDDRDNDHTDRDEDSDCNVGLLLALLNYVLQNSTSVGK